LLVVVNLLLLLLFSLSQLSLTAEGQFKVKCCYVRQRSGNKSPL